MKEYDDDISTAFFNQAHVFELLRKAQILDLARGGSVVLAFFPLKPKTPNLIPSLSKISQA